MIPKASVRSRKLSYSDYTLRHICYLYRHFRCPCVFILPFPKLLFCNWLMVFAHVSTTCLLWSHIRQGPGIDLPYLHSLACLSHGYCPFALHTGCWLGLGALGWGVSLLKRKLAGDSCAVLEPLWSPDRALVPTWLGCFPPYLPFAFYQFPFLGPPYALWQVWEHGGRTGIFGWIFSVHEF